MKPVEVKGNTNIDSVKKVNDNDPKFEVGRHIKISKYKKYFCLRIRTKLVWRSNKKS